MALDSQVREKYSKKYEEIVEEKNYHEFQEKLLREHKLKEKEEKRRKQEMKLILRDSQEKQLKEFHHSKYKERSKVSF